MSGALTVTELVKKLESSISEIRDGACRTLASKLSYRFVSAADLLPHLDRLQRLWHWARIEDEADAEGDSKGDEGDDRQHDEATPTDAAKRATHRRPTATVDHVAAIFTVIATTEVGRKWLVANAQRLQAAGTVLHPSVLSLVVATPQTAPQPTEKQAPAERPPEQGTPPRDAVVAVEAKSAEAAVTTMTTRVTMRTTSVTRSVRFATTTQQDAGQGQQQQDTADAPRPPLAPSHVESPPHWQTTTQHPQRPRRTSAPLPRATRRGAESVELPAGVLGNSEDPASLSPSEQRARVLSQVGAEVAGGWCFPFVRLTKSDEQALFDLHIQFKIRERQTLVRACHKLRHLVLHDFPTEVILQYPSLLYHLVAALQMPIAVPRGDAGDGSERRRRRQLQPRHGTVFGAALGAMRVVLLKLATAKGAVEAAQEPAADDTSPLASVSQVDVQPQFAYPPRPAAAGAAVSAADEVQQRRLSPHEAARIIACGAMPLLKDAHRAVAVVGLLRLAVPLLLEGDWSVMADEDGVAVLDGEVDGDDEDANGIALGVDVRSQVRRVWRRDVARLQTVVDGVAGGVAFYSDEFAALETATSPLVPPLAHLAITLCTMLPPVLTQSHDQPRVDTRRRLAIAPELVALLADVVMHEPLQQAFGYRARLMPYLRRLSPPAADEYVHAGTVVTALRRVEAMHMHLVDGAGLAIPPFHRGCAILGFDAQASGADDGVARDMVEALAYSPDPTAVHVLVWACVVVAASPHASASQRSVCTATLLRLIAFPPSKLVRREAYRCIALAAGTPRFDEEHKGSEADDATAGVRALCPLAPSSIDDVRRRLDSLLHVEFAFEWLVHGLVDSLSVTESEAGDPSVWPWHLLAHVAQVCGQDVHLLARLQPLALHLSGLEALYGGASTVETVVETVVGGSTSRLPPPFALKCLRGLVVALRADSDNSNRVVMAARALFHCQTGERMSAVSELRRLIPMLRSRTGGAAGMDGVEVPAWLRDPAGHVADAGSRSVAAALMHVATSAATAAPTAVTTAIRVQDVRSLATLMHTTTLDDSLRRSAASQLASYLANPEIVARVAPCLDEVVAATMAALQPFDTDVANAALSLAAVLAQYCAGARALMAERRHWLQSLLAYAFSSDMEVQATALRALAWTLFSPRAFQAVSHRETAACAGETLHRGPPGDAPDAGVLVLDAGRWVDVMWLAEAAFGSHIGACTGMNVRTYHVRSPHGVGAAWRLGPQPRPRVSRLVRQLMVAGSEQDDAIAQRWGPGARVAAMLEAVGTARTHASFERRVLALLDAGRAESAVARCAATSSWADAFSRFLSTPPATPGDVVVLCEVLTLLREWASGMSSAALLVLVPALCKHLLPLVWEQVAPRGAAAAAADADAAAAAAADAAATADDSGMAEYGGRGWSAVFGDTDGLAAVEMLRPDAYGHEDGALASVSVAAAKRHIKSAAAKPEHFGRPCTPQDLTLRRLVLEVVEAVCTSATAATSDAGHADDIRGDGGDMGVWLIEPLTLEGNLLTVLARVLSSPVSDHPTRCCAARIVARIGGVPSVLRKVAGMPAVRRQLEQLLPVLVFLCARHRSPDAFVGKGLLRAASKALAGLAFAATSTPQMWWMSSRRDLNWVSRLRADREDMVRTSCMNLLSGLLQCRWGRVLLLHQPHAAGVPHRPSSTAHPLASSLLRTLLSSSASNALRAAAASALVGFVRGSAASAASVVTPPRRSAGRPAGKVEEEEEEEGGEGHTAEDEDGERHTGEAAEEEGQSSASTVSLVWLQPFRNASFFSRLPVLVQQTGHAPVVLESVLMLVQALVQAAPAAIAAVLLQVDAWPTLLEVLEVRPTGDDKGALVACLRSGALVCALVRHALWLRPSLVRYFCHPRQRMAARIASLLAFTCARVGPDAPCARGVLCTAALLAAELVAGSEAGRLIPTVWRGVPEEGETDDGSGHDDSDMMTVVEPLVRALVAMTSSDRDLTLRCVGVHLASRLVSTSPWNDAVRGCYAPSAGGQLPDAPASTLALHTVNTYMSIIRDTVPAYDLRRVVAVLAIAVPDDSVMQGELAKDVARNLRAVLEHDAAARCAVMESGFVAWLLERLAHLTRQADAHALAEARRASHSGRQTRRSRRRPSTSSVGAGSVAAGSVATRSAGHTVDAELVAESRETMRLLASVLVGSEEDIVTAAAEFGLPSLLRRMLITFATTSRSPHTRRWLNDWLAVVVNFVSHSDASKVAILATPATGAAGARAAALAGPNSSLLHAILALHKKPSLALDARQLCCSVLRSVALQSRCRHVLLKGDMVTQQLATIASCMRQRPRSKQAARLARLVTELPVLVNLTLAEDGQVEVLRNCQGMRVLYDLCRHEDVGVVQLALTVVRNCAFHKGNAAHFLGTSTAGMLEHLMLVACGKRLRAPLREAHLQCACVAASALRALTFHSSKVTTVLRNAGWVEDLQRAADLYRADCAGAGDGESDTAYDFVVAGGGRQASPTEAAALSAIVRDIQHVLNA